MVLMMQITSFLPLMRELEIPLFGGDARTLLQSQRGVLDLCAFWEAGFVAPAE
jgi:hypothetical protein